MVVKNILLPVIFAFSLVGCTSITTMSPAQFNQLTTTQIPFAGSWAGVVGPSSTVLSLNRQGSGMFCVDNGKELMSYKVKLVDSVLYTDQGIKFNVKELNNNNAKIHMSLLGLGGTFDLNKDDQLKHVTVRCKQVLSGS
ncbi:MULTISPECIES: J517_1871 family lipoprotein [Acinetobacter]|uniref:Lipoprotein n=2 Tax=Acinetobacter TaxID=469 RepID=A0A558ESV6_9GAMM|nr:MULTISPECIES: J517_1871 family lipoprotein [Acinetobacter]TVT76426.1 hypothetical protein FPV60_20080 [Acinetobacter colistiniresistens]UUM29017.1 hypothetical protein NQU59_08035 [Acinetobacter colistiniresistens]